MGMSESGFECSREGLTIRGTEYRPAGSNLPAAIVCHGFMANQSTVRHYARYLAKWAMQPAASILTAEA